MDVHSRLYKGRTMTRETKDSILSILNTEEFKALCAAIQQTGAVPESSREYETVFNKFTELTKDPISVTLFIHSGIKEDSENITVSFRPSNWPRKGGEGKLRIALHNPEFCFFLSYRDAKLSFTFDP